MTARLSATALLATLFGVLFTLIANSVSGHVFDHYDVLYLQLAVLPLAEAGDARQQLDDAGLTLTDAASKRAGWLTALPLLLVLLMFGAKDGLLKQWTVTDPQGYDTTFAVYNLDATKKLDPGMFKIDFTNYSVPTG